MTKNDLLKLSVSIILLLGTATACNSTELDTFAPVPTNEASYNTEYDSAVDIGEEDNKRLLEAKVLRVVDGDTMKVSIDGKKETIRLLLVDTPESVKPDLPEPQPFAIEASNFAKKMLTDKDVQIELGISERDKYGRLLCYLYVDGKMFNETLLEQGFARVAYVFAPNVKYVDEFRTIQDKARKRGLGIWSIENYAQEDGFHEENSSEAKSSSTGSKPKVTSQPTATVGTVYYKSCEAVRAAGAAPLKKEDPGYRENLDGDKDGIACE